jgi:cation:H+ antiporter
MVLQIAFFLVALAVMSGASVALTAGLERIGARLGPPEALLGLIAALGADAPEISSAMASLYWGHHEVSVGVVLGSNIFNLAGLLGLSAMVAGRIDIGRAGLLVNGSVGLLVTVAASALVLGWILPWIAFTGIALLFSLYVILSSLRSTRIRHLPGPGGLRRFLEAAIEQAHRDTRKRNVLAPASWKDTLVVIASAALIILASASMVDIAVALAARWSISHAVVGYLVLAILTSVPNVVAAIRLADEGRGVAVVSESLNSNTLNIIGGICLPALVFGMAAPSPRIEFSTLWLLGMSAIAMVAASSHKGLPRGSGAVLVLLYLIYAGVMLWW